MFGMDPTAQIILAILFGLAAFITSLSKLIPAIRGPERRDQWTALPTDDRLPSEGAND